MSAPVATIILPAGTGAADSSEFVVGQGRVTAMLTAPLTGSDVITLQYQTPAGTWVNAADQLFSGTVRFSANVNMIQIDGAGVYRFSRPAISTAVGVFIRGKNV